MPHLFYGTMYVWFVVTKRENEDQLGALSISIYLSSMLSFLLSPRTLMKAHEVR
jgi:hypothetical protein